MISLHHFKVIFGIAIRILARQRIRTCDVSLPTRTETNSDHVRRKTLDSISCNTYRTQNLEEWFVFI